MNVDNNLLSLTKTLVCIFKCARKRSFTIVSQEPRLSSLRLHLWYEYFLLKYIKWREENVIFHPKKKPQKFWRCASSPSCEQIQEMCTEWLSQTSKSYLVLQPIPKDLK